MLTNPFCTHKLCWPLLPPPLPALPSNSRKESLGGEGGPASSQPLAAMSWAPGSLCRGRLKQYFPFLEPRQTSPGTLKPVQVRLPRGQELTYSKDADPCRPGPQACLLHSAALGTAWDEGLQSRGSVLVCRSTPGQHTQVGRGSWPGKESESRASGRRGRGASLGLALTVLLGSPSLYPGLWWLFYSLLCPPEASSQ